MCILDIKGCVFSCVWERKWTQCWDVHRTAGILVYYWGSGKMCAYSCAYKHVECRLCQPLNINPNSSAMMIRIIRLCLPQFFFLSIERQFLRLIHTRSTFYFVRSLPIAHRWQFVMSKSAHPSAISQTWSTWYFLTILHRILLIQNQILLFSSITLFLVGMPIGDFSINARSQFRWCCVYWLMCESQRLAPFCLRCNTFRLCVLCRSSLSSGCSGFSNAARPGFLWMMSTAANVWFGWTFGQRSVRIFCNKTQLVHAQNRCRVAWMCRFFFSFLRFGGFCYYIVYRHTRDVRSRKPVWQRYWQRKWEFIDYEDITRVMWWWRCFGCIFNIFRGRCCTLMLTLFMDPESIECCVNRRLDWSVR